MYRKMLVVLDGSQLAEIVFPYARELAGRLGLDVVLLHVYSPDTRDFAPMYKAYIDQAAAHVQEEARKVQASANGKPARLVEARGELKEGYHADEILRYVDENAIDLVLMASHGRSGVQRWRMGSVADKILRASKVPIWLVHAEAKNAVPYDQWPSRTLLVALSGSDVSASSIPHALQLAQQKGVKVDVVLMQVVELPIAPSYYSPELTGVPLNWGQFVEQEMNRSKKAAQEYLAGVARQFTDAGIAATTVVLSGKAAEEIQDFAGKNPYTVIVMATHGRKGISRLVYGSVAESVLYNVTNPMVLVSPQ
jgi:nucleotide-binding universal stress UspA family protein